MLPHLSFFLHFSMLIFFRIDPLRFQAVCCKRRLNCLLFFCVAVHFFRLVNACFCCVRFSFFPYQARRLAWETSPKSPILCRAGRKTTTQPVSQCDVSLNLAGSSLDNTDDAYQAAAQQRQLQAQKQRLDVLLRQPIRRADYCGKYPTHSSQPTEPFVLRE